MKPNIAAAVFVLGVPAAVTLAQADSSRTPRQFPAVPYGAQVAGFTTLAYDGDATYPLRASWVGGCPNGPDGNPVQLSDDKGHIWFQNQWWWPDYYPCLISQHYDAVAGTLVVDIPWFSDTNQAQVGNQIETISYNYDGHGAGSVGISFPNNAYYELTSRLDPVFPAVKQDFNTWGINGVFDPSRAGIEWDIDEGRNPGVGPYAVFHNWENGANGWIYDFWDHQTRPIPYDYTVYNTDGLLVASDGNNAIGCGFINNKLMRCGDLVPLTADEKDQRLFLQVGTKCDIFTPSFPGYCPWDGHWQHLLIQSIRVWSCPNWRTDQCNVPAIPSWLPGYTPP